MKQHTIILSLIALLIVSFSFLAFSENKQHKIENDWFLYFENPQNNSLNFIIENFSDDNNFSWSLITDNEKQSSKKIKVLKDISENVIVEKLPEGKNFTIEVIHGKEKRKIYKIL